MGEFVYIREVGINVFATRKMYLDEKLSKNKKNILFSNKK